MPEIIKKPLNKNISLHEVNKVSQDKEEGIVKDVGIISDTKKESKKKSKQFSLRIPMIVVEKMKIDNIKDGFKFVLTPQGEYNEKIADYDYYTLKISYVKGLNEFKKNSKNI
jgi:hypothetical protein